MSQPTLGLSAHELEILRLVTVGNTREEVAELLNVSARTVANYRSLIRQKLGIGTAIELYRLARDCGVMEAAPAWAGFFATSHSANAG